MRAAVAEANGWADDAELKDLVKEAVKSWRHDEAGCQALLPTLQDNPGSGDEIVEEFLRSQRPPAAPSAAQPLQRAQPAAAPPAAPAALSTPPRRSGLRKPAEQPRDPTPCVAENAWTEGTPPGSPVALSEGGSDVDNDAGAGEVLNPYGAAVENLMQKRKEQGKKLGEKMQPGDGIQRMRAMKHRRRLHSP